jgi:hypothetical protein
MIKFIAFEVSKIYSIIQKILNIIELLVYILLINHFKHEILNY